MSRPTYGQSDQLQILLDQAQTFLDEGRYEQAMEGANQAFSVAADRKSESLARLIIAKAAIRLHEDGAQPLVEQRKKELLSSAENALNAIKSENPGFSGIGWVYYYLGFVCTRREQWQLASNSYREAVALAGEDVELAVLSRAELGNLYCWKMGRFRDAVEILGQAIDLARDWDEPYEVAQVYLDLSRVHARSGAYALSIETALQAEQLMDQEDPRLTEVHCDALHLRMDALYRMDGHENEALGLYKLSMEECPDLWRELSGTINSEHLGALYQRIGNREMALKYTKQALEMDPESPIRSFLNYHIGVNLLHLQRPREAVEYLLTSLTTDDESPKVEDYLKHARLADGYYMLADFARAAARYQEAIRLAPKQAEELPILKQHLKEVELRMKQQR